MVLWQSDLKHLCSLVPLLVPCEFLPLWFRTIGNASLLRLIRKHDVSGETNTRSRPLEGPAIADRAETHPTVGHKHVKKGNEQAGVRKQSQSAIFNFTLVSILLAPSEHLRRNKRRHGNAPAGRQGHTFHNSVSKSDTVSARLICV